MHTQWPILHIILSLSSTLETLLTRASALHHAYYSERNTLFSSQMAPHVSGILRFSTDCEVIVTERRVSGSSETCYCITRQCGLKGSLMACECLFWFNFFSKAHSGWFLSHFLCTHALTVTSAIIRLILQTGKPALLSCVFTDSCKKFHHYQINSSNK